VSNILFIEIDIFWNSTSLNTSIKIVIKPELILNAISSVSLIYKPFNTVGTEVRSTNTTTSNYFNIFSILWSGYSGLTGLTFNTIFLRNISPKILANSSFWTLLIIIS